MPDCHTLIISDIHLGSKVCRPDKVLRVLRETHFKNLVINGDLFDSANIEKLTPEHWEILTLISDIAKTHPTIMVGGNHGREMDKMVKKMKVRIADNHAFSVGGREFLCLHGDEFDLFIKYLPATGKLFTKLFHFIQRFGGHKQRVFMMFVRWRRFLGVSRSQQRKAIEEGAAQEANVVICSHTHLPYVGKRNGILFVNSGSFCNEPSTYVTIDRSGLVGLQEI